MTTPHRSAFVRASVFEAAGDDALATPQDETRRWRMISTAEPPRGAFEKQTRRRAVAAAVRSAHALAADWAVSVRGGPAPSIELETGDAPSARWFVRTLSAVYGPHRWRFAGRPSGSRVSSDVWVGGRRCGWPTPLRGPEDASPMVDALAMALGGVRAPATVRLRFVPSPLARSPLAAPEPAVPEHRGRPPLGRPPSTRPSGPAVVWRCQFSLEFDPPGPERRSAEACARAVESAARSVTGNGILLTPPRPWSRAARPFELTEDELVELLPEGIERELPPPALGHGGDVRRLAIGRTPRGQVIGVPVEATQGRHLAVTGETGMGKSSLLVALARRAAEGAGVVFFDPVGDSARRFRAELPPAMLDRTIVVAPDRPRGLNALRAALTSAERDPARAERGLTDLVHALRRVRAGRYADSAFWGPRLEEMLSRALAAAAAFPDGTLVDAHRLLASGGRGFRVAPAEALPGLNELADRIRNRPEDAEGARRLLFEVVRNPILVRMLCDPDGDLSPERLVAPGAIALISGQAGRVGEATARYALSVYLALVWSALLSRERSGKTFVVLDEAQWFAHESLAEMLRLGRRSNVHVVLATQSLAALPEPVAEAVWTNVADFVAFRGSPAEAREFVRGLPHVEVHDLLSLPRGEAGAFLGKGESIRWVRTVRLPDREGEPPPPTVEGQSPEAARTDRSAVPMPPSIGTRASGASVERVLEEISTRAERAATAAPIRIELEELRRTADPEGRAVRTVGTMLERTGALVGTGRSVHGAYWWVDPARLVLRPGAGRPAAGPSAEEEA